MAGVEIVAGTEANQVQMDGGRFLDSLALRQTPIAAEERGRGRRLTLDLSIEHSEELGET